MLGKKAVRRWSGLVAVDRLRRALEGVPWTLGALDIEDGGRICRQFEQQTGLLSMAEWTDRCELPSVATTLAVPDHRAGRWET